MGEWAHIALEYGRISTTSPHMHIRKNRTRELCIMSHNEGLYPIIPRYISPFLIRKQLAALAAALAAAHYSLRIPSIHAICIDLIQYSMYCKDVLQTKYIQPNGM